MTQENYITGKTYLTTGNERYRTVKGWSGTKYRVRMTKEEIRARETFGLAAGILIGVPFWIWIMAIAAGLI